MKKKEYRDTVATLGPLVQGPIWLVYVALFFFVTYLAIFVGGKEELVPRIVAVAMTLSGLYILIFKYGYRKLKSTVYVWVDDTTLSYKKMFGGVKTISYSNIDRIGSLDKDVNAWVYTADSPPIFIMIPGQTYKFGELMEFLCEKATNATEVDFEYFLNSRVHMHDYWQKEVNLDIMNMAKARADANRRKKDIKQS